MCSLPRAYCSNAATVLARYSADVCCERFAAIRYREHLSTCVARHALFFPQHRIALPVAQSLPPVGLLRPLIDPVCHLQLSISSCLVGVAFPAFPAQIIHQRRRQQMYLERMVDALITGRSFLWMLQYVTPDDGLWGPIPLDLFNQIHLERAVLPPLRRAMTESFPSLPALPLGAVCGVAIVCACGFRLRRSSRLMLDGLLPKLMPIDRIVFPFSIPTSIFSRSSMLKW